MTCRDMLTPYSVLLHALLCRYGRVLVGAVLASSSKCGRRYCHLFRFAMAPVDNVSPSPPPVITSLER